MPANIVLGLTITFGFIGGLAMIAVGSFFIWRAWADIFGSMTAEQGSCKQVDIQQKIRYSTVLELVTSEDKYRELLVEVRIRAEEVERETPEVKE